MLSIEKYASALRKLFGAARPPETLRFGRREHQLDQDAPSDVAVRERPERIGELIDPSKTALQKLTSSSRTSRFSSALHASGATARGHLAEQKC
jgi:hypothetical protein